MLSLMVSTAALLSPPRVAITGSTGKLGTEAVKHLDRVWLVHLRGVVWLFTLTP